MTDSRRLIPSILFCIVLSALIAHPLAEAADQDAALVTAAEIGIIEDVRALLDAGVDPNARNESGWTALMQAAMNGHTDVAKLLLARGAKVNAKGDAGWEALMLAAQFGHIDIVAILIQRNANVDATSRNGFRQRPF